MIYLCLLAAGGGTRFGSNKLLSMLDGLALWEHGYQTLTDVARQTGASLYVVSRYPEILRQAGRHGISCPESVNGLSFSVRAACRACGTVGAEDKLLFLAADQPYIRVETILKLLSVPFVSDLEDDGYCAACPSDGKHQGNPVVFSGLLVPRLETLRGDRGGKSILSCFPRQVAEIPCTSAELADVDTPADLDALGSLYS